MKKKLQFLIVAILTMFMATMGVKATCDGASPDNNEAMLASKTGGDPKYCSLKDAIDAANEGDTVSLLKDITYSGEENRIEIDNKNITFDFGKFTITSADNFNSNKATLKVSGTSKVTFVGTGGIKHTKGGSALLVTGSAEVTINGGNYDSIGNVNDEQNYGAISVVGSTAKLYIDGENVKITSENTGGVAVLDGATLDMKNGTISAKSFGISGNATSEESSKITITGGTVESTGSTAIYHPQKGDLTISGGTIKGLAGIVAREGTITVKDGANIIGTGSGQFAIGATDINLTAGSAIVVDNQTASYSAPAKVVVEGGTLEASAKDAISSYGTDANHENYELTGGTYISAATGDEKPFDEEYIKSEDQATIVKSGNKYALGETSAKEVVADAQSGDTIEVLQGNLEVNNVPEGVTVTNKGTKNNVVVDGTKLNEGESKYTPVTHYTPSTPTKDYTIVEGVKYEENGDNIEIEGSIIKDKTDVYEAMLKYASDKGFTKLYNMYEFHVKDGKSLTNPVVITFDLGKENDGKTAYVLHQKHDNTYDEYKAVVTDGIIKIRVYELSPFIVMLEDKKNEEKEDVPQIPNTIDNIGIYSAITILGIAVLGLTTKKVLNKHN